MKNELPLTEQIYPSDKQIDQLDINSAFNFMINDHSSIYQVIKENETCIVEIVKFLTNHLIKNKSGRLIYCGAGTSGRIAVQDSIELYPTFGWPMDRMDFIIAGGNDALIKSVENSEDNRNEARNSFKIKKISSKDVVICIAASGNTPFTNEIINLSNKNKIKTIAISNNPHGNLHKKANYKIILNTGQEVVAGSTRLKAGSAQKLCLNILSTLLMTRLGRVKNGLMINLVPNNEKLRKRNKRIKTLNKENTN